MNTPSRIVLLASLVPCTVATANPGCPAPLFGSFAYPSTVDTAAIATGDVDGDGVVDIAVPSREPEGVLVLLGSGTGMFSQASLHGTEPAASTLLLEDVNDDGLDDLIFGTDEIGDDVSIRLSQGDGTFSDERVVATIGLVSTLTANDFNGDGAVDIVIGYSDVDRVQIAHGDGNGVFADAGDYAAGGPAAMLASGDFNGDGHLDAAVASPEFGGVSVLPGNDEGTFDDPIATAIPVPPTQVAAGDLDHDGVLDLIVTNNSPIFVLHGHGDGTFTPEQTVGYEYRSLDAIALTDADEDGRVDILCTGYEFFTGATSVSVYRGMGDRTFTFGGPRFGRAGGIRAMAVVDVDGDDHVDVVIDGDADSGIVLLGAGDATFGPPPTPTEHAAVFAHPVDIDGDGDLDLILANKQSTFSRDFTVLRNHGGGVFDDEAGYGSDNWHHFIAIGDFDDDGVSDVAITGGSHIMIYRGSSDGSFTPINELDAAVNAKAIIAVDFDDDGSLDIATINTYEDAVWVRRGLGDGSFLAADMFALGAEPYDVAAGDLNGDGAPDLAIATAGGVSILANLGDATFAPESRLFEGSIRWSIAVADLDGDTARDLITAGRPNDDADHVVSVWLNDGSGAFPTDEVMYDTGLNPLGIDIVDMDGDRVVDVVSRGSHDEGKDFVVLFGAGDGSLHSPTRYHMGRSPGPVALADFDGDGSVDMATPSSNEGVLVQLSRCAVCTADIDGSTDVGLTDLLAVIIAWGPCPPECPEDIDDSGDVGMDDLLMVLTSWGPCD